MRVREVSWLKVLLLVVVALVGIGAWGLYTVQEARAGTSPFGGFKCYETTGNNLNEPVRLFDPFHDGPISPSEGGEAVTVKGAHLVCAPLLAKCFPEQERCERFEPSPVGLKCYKITPSGPPVNETIRVFDQFGPEELNVGPAQFLCEPAGSPAFEQPIGLKP